MVSAFFALLSRANPRPELRWWARAWTANFIALVATSVHWLLQPDPLFPVITAFYVAGKTAFAAMLAQGAWAMIRPGARLLTTRGLAIGVTIYSIAAAIVLSDLNVVGIAQHSLMGVVLIALAIALWRSGADGVTWLYGAIAVRGLLAIADSFRPDDHVVRYGGDEFLVIARGLDTAAARIRVEDLTDRFKRSSPTVWCGFSVGMSELAPGGEPEPALQLADQNMYKAKNLKRR
jgi:Diguanylate cyclase, GGDEF domain